MAANSKLNLEVFLTIVRQSGLIEAEVLKQVLAETTGQRGLDDARELAAVLVSRNLVTRWQADKLMQGKHRGFFLGKYRLLSHLGTGGMSSVYLAEHVLMRRRVAIKVLPRSRVNDSSYLERFHREARAVASLDHRNIVRAYDVDQEDQNHFLVMEYVPGYSLHELVTKRGRLDFVPAAEYARQAADGLHHAHRMGMVHRDIKPGNLLLDDKGTIKLLDLGLARFFDEDEDQSLTRKHDERILGTADYLSPEQAIDSHSADVRSDIYSLGCTLYFFLTGRPPFPDGTLAQRLLAHQTRQPPALERERPDIPSGLAAIVCQMMAKQPEQRFQTALAASQALLSWLSEHGGRAWTELNPLAPSGSSLIGRAPPSSFPSSSSHVFGSPRPPVAATGQAADIAAVASQPAAEPELAAFLSNLAAHESGPLSSAETHKTPSRSQVRVDADAARSEPAPQAASAVKNAQPAVRTGKVREAKSSGAHVADSQRDRAAAVAPSEQNALVESGRLAFSGAIRPGSPLASRKVQIVSVVVGGIILAAVLLALLNRPEANRAAAKTASSTKPTADAKVSSRAAVRRPAASRDDFSVGPAAEFKTIGEALAEAKKQAGNRRRAPVTIRVAAGQTYAERIVIDGTWPRGLHLVAEEGLAPVLAPNGPEPILLLDGSHGEVNDFLLQGFQLEAAGKPAAVRLTGWLPGARLRRLKVFGIEQAGVVLDSAQTYGAEEARIVMEGNTFEGRAGDSVGILFTRHDEDPAHVRIRGCLFLSSLAAGVRFSSNVLDVEIEESIFFRINSGVVLDGEQPNWRDVTFAYNTFYETDRGIVFTDMPAAGTRGLGFYNNLFVNTGSADAIVAKEFDAKRFMTMFRTSPGGIAFNWTTRPRETSVVSGGLTNLFETGQGKSGVNSLKFQTLDPQAANFLAPGESSPHRNVGTLLDRRRFGTQVGAVR